ncbi:sodium:calcium antiporter [Candidatus Uabimicrobium amorphum]|uniref:Cation transporter n=1 Tax=Uabimicrobium amorphum TaxID=2596890 RepID=A0A5S9ILU9_UABAM|nr:sodium:calcium antiporter [Candidatus Uabimicrobium amorphum]BBM83722.1 cation transporter [Candidatus Uabimicrobium amorphum]
MDIPLWMCILYFAVSGIIITWAGIHLAGLADHIADRTGLGEAVTGAILLGASTSLPGITTSIVAASSGYPNMAMSNALGGIAAQTSFLAIADFCNREANLEHQAASIPNILNGQLLIILLGGILLANSFPEITIFGVHVFTPILFITYVFGMNKVKKSHEKPQWLPLKTLLTRVDIPDTSLRHQQSLPRMFAMFFVFSCIMALAGWALAQSGINLVKRTGIDETIIGGFITAVITSIPELVTAIAAVRRGALTLAVGDIIGGNAFDVMFAVASDIAYRPGSIYHTISNEVIFLTALSIIMSGILVAGLVIRERKGIANIGFESFSVLLLYIMGFFVITMF